jgi:hypothetical protein
MLVPFNSALTSRQLFVNPALVRSVVDGVQMGQVKICFDDQHSVTVLGTTSWPGDTRCRQHVDRDLPDKKAAALIKELQ